MWNGKNKAITFSFDDGITQDIRFIEILDKYKLKCTFNLNSGLFGNKDMLDQRGFTVTHYKVDKTEVKDIYKNHEIAAHSLTHPYLNHIKDDNEVIRQVEEDRLALSDICGYNVVGMAYPCSKENKRVADIVKNNTGIKYSRSVTSTDNFDLQSDLYHFNPSAYSLYKEKLFEIGKRFLELKTDTPQLFYIWGHAYEFDFNSPQFTDWSAIDEFCSMISGKDDIFYGTNKEVLL